MLEAEEYAKRLKDQIKDAEKHIDAKVQKLEQDRTKHKAEICRLEHLRDTVEIAHEHIQMQKED